MKSQEDIQLSRQRHWDQDWAPLVAGTPCPTCDTGATETCRDMRATFFRIPMRPHLSRLHIVYPAACTGTGCVCGKQ